MPLNRDVIDFESPLLPILLSRFCFFDGVIRTRPFSMGLLESKDWLIVFLAPVLPLCRLFDFSGNCEDPELPQTDHSFLVFLPLAAGCWPSFLSRICGDR